jgi:hypothetical protein
MLQLINRLKFIDNDIIVFTSLGTKVSIRPAVSFIFLNVARALKRLHTSGTEISA